MIALERPMFMEFPEFGLSKEFTKPHPGFFSWNVLHRWHKSHAGLRQTPLLQVVDRALAKTFRELGKR